jgi:hypothetical protein
MSPRVLPHGLTPLDASSTSTSPAIGGAGLQREHLALAIDAFTVASPQFRDWVLAQASVEGLLSRRERDKQLAKLEKAVREAETQIVRAQLEAEKQAAEAKLAALERGDAA